ncbi:MAG: type VI secretion lipoprotein TssJ [Myxococcota bacterium]
MKRGAAGSERRAARDAKRLLAGALALSTAWWATACGGPPKPVESCLTITSGTNLHTYEGQPHSLPLYIYALSSSIEFEQTDISTLLAGDDTPEGVVGGPLELIVFPDQVVEFREALDPRTIQLGIVADYYRSANDPPGQRRAVVPAKCGTFGSPAIRLTPTDLLVE